jgi:hypothetical protein
MNAGGAGPTQDKSAGGYQETKASPEEEDSAELAEGNKATSYLLVSLLRFVV